MKLDLHNLDWKIKVIICLLPLAIIGVPSYFYFYQPKLNEIDKIQKEIAKMNADIEIASKKAKKLESLKVKLAKAQRADQEIKKQLPEEREITPLFELISAMCIRSGLTIETWKPFKPSKQDDKGEKDDNLQIAPALVTVTVQGTFHSFGAFLSQLTHLNRIFNILDIRIKAAPIAPAKQDATEPVVVEEAKVSISFTGVTFSYIPPEERKGHDKGKEKVKGK